MKIIATSDTHYFVQHYQIPSGDVFIHAGDLCTSGYIDEWNEQLKWLGNINPNFVKRYFIPGNHDFHIQNYPGPALQDMRRIGFTVLGFPGNVNFYTDTLPNGMTIGGCCYVSGLQNRWAFGEKTFRDFDCNPEEIIEMLIKTCDIVVTHVPFKDILDISNRTYTNVGEIIFKKCLDKCIDDHTCKVKYVIHGHVHEMYGSTDYKGIKFFNVAMCDRTNTHKNEPIELII